MPSPPRPSARRLTAEIGWRLVALGLGQGLRDRGRRGAALDDVFTRVGLDEVLAYTAIDNLRSQAVMRRLGLRRDPTRDFDVYSDDEPWHGLVWVAEMRRARDASLSAA